ncbi:hypothetical protein [Benzoatithermus flavus]|uniref:Uncharacterized protein n=1 Tax=Benzoatithermus flavus TaxID=3108223 RepID=A0ABU8XRT8_9PROT
MLRRYFGMLSAAALMLPVIAGSASAASADPPHRGLPYVKLAGVVHIENLGDKPLRDGRWAGTMGRSLRLEGFQLASAGRLGGNTHLEYMCHVQDLGDLPAPNQWYARGEFCGTRGQSKRLEGFAIRVAGRNAALYDVLYQCHVQDLGTSDVKKNGEFCGTRGQQKRVEAMRVVVLKNWY